MGAGMGVAMEECPAEERRSHERVLLPLTSGAVSAMLPAVDGGRHYSSVWNLSLGGACLLLPRGGGDELVAEGVGAFSDADGCGSEIGFRVVWVEGMGRSHFVGVAFATVPLPAHTILESFLTR